ncbi:ABC transporter ATP-binding protein [Streptosporangium sp. V21-05]|uniref:ABC transporter ATP-binding protein n=1 Tax=Streptosporangium sp. V21-05 TaxID=3446115 RepID=UPI003F5313B6
MASMIRAQELYRFYRAGDEEVKALRGVSLEVAAGEVVVVTGPSGSGKSTLLACLAGLDEPDGGAVWIDSIRISHRPEAQRAALRARRVGVLLRSGNLIEHLTVRQNLDLAQKVAGRRDPRWADQVLDITGLSTRARAWPSTLSGGETARAGLVVALANRPAVLVADEPTAELGRGIEKGVLTLLRERADQNSAVVIASHSPAVRRFAGRVVALHDGRIA